MFRNVLIGVSGSASARGALSQAIAIAQASHGRIGLLGAAPEASLLEWTRLFTPAMSPPRLAEEVEAGIRRQLDEAERAVPAEVAVAKLLAHASPAAALVTHAYDGPWDLVVVGRRPCSERRLFRGDVGARLLRSSPVPVLIVPGVA